MHDALLKCKYKTWPCAKIHVHIISVYDSTSCWRQVSVSNQILVIYFLSCFCFTEKLEDTSFGVENRLLFVKWQ